ncbi:MAG TPA: FAD-binding oxidoreductase [Candidatus Saccharimonadales bacterium]|nr:FAD-binding oxidoreductase [Candidatus Saccharimonadales bacterium]
MAVDRRGYHQSLVDELAKSLAGNTKPIRIKKRSVSNLFRYDGRQSAATRLIDLGDFNQPLFLDTKQGTLEVQGLTTFEAIVDFVLPHGFTPVVTPELKHITIGGATVGIGIETNSFKYGFVHDSLLEAQVLLPDGRVVVANESNEHADLFAALANSYGTLGYILKAKIKLLPAKPYVQITTAAFTNTKDLVEAMGAAAKDPNTDYIESLLYSPSKLFLSVGTKCDTAPKLTSIYGQTVFYRRISQPGTLWLTTKDYLFRYDPEWFWAIPETPAYRVFRALSPRRFRNSAFYTRYLAWQAARNPQPEPEHLEKLIQDWEVPWQHSQALLDFALKNLRLDEKPLLAAPTKTLHKNTLYPMPPNQLYMNLGSYSFVERKPNDPPYHYTKIMDDFCFSHDGIKMLYSSSFLDENTFNTIYGGSQYKKIKAKYDPHNLAPTLYQKAVQAK